MRSRGLVVALAVLLAAAAAAAVVLYTNGVKQDAETGGTLTTVIVATADIPANTSLDTLVDSGGFKELNLPAEAVVAGAVTSLAELRGQTTTAPIVANEQLTSSNLSSGEQVEGGILGISKGHIAVTVKLGAPQGVNGAVHNGDNVSVFATFTGVKVLQGGTLAQIIHGTSPSSTTGGQAQDLPDFTATIIPTVRVLDVVNPGIDATTGDAVGDSVTLTLDLTPKQAQDLIFAGQLGVPYIGLLAPGEEGTVIPASTVPAKLLLGKLAAA
jgi:Flp pilus assembly protein CpaB